MLELKCDKCGSMLNQPGALVFSPPIDRAWSVEKYHLCVACWSTLAEQLGLERPANNAGASAKQ